MSSVNQKNLLNTVGVPAGLVLSFLGLAILILSWLGISLSPIFLWLCLGSLLTGMMVFGVSTYAGESDGIKNNGIWTNSLTNRGLLAWVSGVVITGFYIELYWYPELLGLNSEGVNTGMIAFFDPLSYAIKGAPASQWFVYGTIYTICIVGLGVKFVFKYIHNRYQLWRTISVMAAQLFLAYFIPEILEGMNQDQPYFAKDLKYFWPLNYYFFEDWHLNNMTDQASGAMGMFYMVWGILGFTVLTPIITYFVGKRWYCSWVCGCGGLAETAGDPFRHLSDKSIKSWKLERWLIHGVLVYISVVTAVVLYAYFTNSSSFLGLDVNTYFRRPYAFLIGAAFSGIIGVGFYPLLGNRVWCRFGCPMAAYMGIVQRFKSKFRITTNGGQCISCGNCSVYCEQGIDVRSYAQKGQNIVRASCVGCGVCSAVCPRGVLKLENGPEENRVNDNPILIGHEKTELNKEVI
ncbi:MAG: FeS-binding protein [Crocinitomicaceae bacterium]|nr:FeS-binding protein [Crocinitomicaceae bacterium]|tara:strand:- start:54872 stop:56257 length:1386 start_codon:yes stop_codon:yes gene_type:complete